VQVIDCRRVLKYTYVLGFFLRDHSPEKQLFEHHQEMLEKNTERLQEYTELTLDQIDRTQVGFEVLCMCRDTVGLQDAHLWFGYTAVVGLIRLYRQRYFEISV
jgi:membrane protein YqaA with SNARE-associated domain